MANFISKGLKHSEQETTKSKIMTVLKCGKSNFEAGELLFPLESTFKKWVLRHCAQLKRSSVNQQYLPLPFQKSLTEKVPWILCWVWLSI